MASIDPPKAVQDLPSAQKAPPKPEPSPVAKAGEQRATQHVAALRSKVEPNKLVVQLDSDAQRFVQTVTDADTKETVRRYPSEAQLAYSRAVMAYLRAQMAR